MTTHKIKISCLLAAPIAFSFASIAHSNIVNIHFPSNVTKATFTHNGSDYYSITDGQPFNGVNATFNNDTLSIDVEAGRKDSNEPTQFLVSKGYSSIARTMNFSLIGQLHVSTLSHDYTCNIALGQVPKFTSDFHDRWVVYGSKTSFSYTWDNGGSSSIYCTDDNTKATSSFMLAADTKNTAQGNFNANIKTPVAHPIVGYYTSWSIYGNDSFSAKTPNYQPSDIPSQVNQINYAFTQIGACKVDNAKPAPETNPSLCNKQVSSYDHKTIIQPGIQDYKLHTTDPWSDFYEYHVDSNGNHISSGGTNIGHYGNIANALHTGKPVILSIGGWTLSAAIRPAIEPTHVGTFVTSIINFMHDAENDANNHYNSNYKFAGVDIDWEPNGNHWTLASSDPTKYVSVSASDLDNYYNFLSKLKSALIANGYQRLSVALTANPMVLANVDQIRPNYWKNIVNLGVTLNLMTYDYNAQAWAGSCKYTQFNAPLWYDSKNPCTDNLEFDANDSFITLEGLGVPSSHIGIGVPLYGYAYSLDNINPAGLPYATFNKNPQNVYNPAGSQALWNYRQILTGRTYDPKSTSENTTWTYNVDDYSVGQSYALAFVNRTFPAFITYTSYNDAANSMKYIVNNNGADVIVWELDQDVRPGDYSSDGNPIDVNKTSVVAGLASAQSGN